MDGIKAELEIADLKLDYLRKSLDQVNAQASSILLFTLKWRDLEDHFEKTRTSVEKQALEVSLRERQLGETTLSLEQRCREVEMKERDLGDVQRKVDELCADQEKRENQLALIRTSIQECTEDIHLKEEQLSVVRNSLDDSNEKLCSKEKQLSTVLKSIEDLNEELCLKKKQLNTVRKNINNSDREFCSKEKQLNTLLERIEECTGELCSKEMQFNSTKKFIEDCDGKLCAKEKQLNSISKSIEDHTGELCLKEKQLSGVRKSIEDCNRELDSREKKLNRLCKSIEDCNGEFESREKQLNTLCKSIEIRNGELCSKEMQFSVLCKSIEECHKKHNLKVEELKSLEKSTKECSGELQLNERELGSVKKTLVECCGELSAKDQELRSKKEQLGLCQNELEECCQQLNWEKEKLKSVEKKLNMLQGSIRDSQAELHLLKNELDGVNKSNQECTQGLELRKKQIDQNLTRDGRNLKLFLARHLKDQDSLYAEVIATFTTSPDPAKLVLDELHSSSWKDNMEFNSNIMRRTSILLLERMMKLSPYIKPQVREDAMKLAKEWKAELSEPPDNTAQVMCFMLLLAAFKLVSAFNMNELHRLLDFLGQQRQVPELRRAIKEANELPLSKILPSQVKVEQNENLTVNNKTETSFATLQSCTSKEIRDLLTVLNDLDASEPKVLAAFQISPDPVKLVLDTMQESLYHLWKKGDTGFQASFMRKCVVLLEQAMRVSQKIQLQPQVKVAAKKLAMEWKEKLKANTDNSFEVLCFLQFLATYESVSFFKREEISRLIDIATPHRQAPEISQSLGFTDKIPGLIQDLISRRQHLDAVRFSCEFNLVGMFPPARLLKQYWEISGKAVSSISKKGMSAREAQEARERELDSLKALIRCVTDYKLEKDFSTVEIKKRLNELERQKTGGRLAVTAPSTLAQLPVQDERSSMNASIPRDQLQQRTSKRLREDELITTPNATRPRVSNRR